MWRSRLALVLVLALALSTVVIAPVQAQTIRVIVDGSPVFFDQPPVSIGGRVLVPVRGVFERMGATVQWNPMTNTVLAVRGTTQIQLMIGSRQAYVNGVLVTLDVPAMVINGRTLVPLRFISESLGATVDWDEASRTVLITSSGVARPPVTRPPVVQPPQPPSPGQSVIEGTVFRVDVNTTPQRLYVQRGDQIFTIFITPNTAITRVNATTGQGGAVSLADVRVGDQVTVTVDAQNQAILVRVQTREVSGRIDAVAGRTIVLSSGQVYQLADGARILVNGREVSAADLRAGMDVTLRLSASGQVVEVSAQAAQPPAGTVTIASLTHNASRPLRVGETLTVTLRGTAGGTATFDVFGIAQGVPMNAVSAGVYQGSYTVRSGENIVNAAIFGHLRVAGVEAVPVQAASAVTIDTLAPVITDRAPEPNSVVANSRPNILITYMDQGSGVNPGASALIVNGQNVTSRATVTATAMAYAPQENLSGTVTVQVVLRDRAGNEAADSFRFTIGVPQGSLIRAVTLNPTTPLQPGQTLTVTALGESGAQAFFSIEGVVDSVPMVEVAGQPGVYVGQYLVRAQDNVQNARVFVTFTRAGVTQRMEASSQVTLLSQQTPAPTITSPAAGSRVGAPIVVRGTAQPGAQVVVRVDYEGSLLLFSVRGTYGEVATTADASGNWSVSMNPTIRIPNAQLTITAVAIDAAGRRSAPVRVQVTQI